MKGKGKKEKRGILGSCCSTCCATNSEEKGGGGRGEEGGSVSGSFSSTVPARSETETFFSFPFSFQSEWREGEEKGGKKRRSTATFPRACWGVRRKRGGKGKSFCTPGFSKMRGGEEEKKKNARSLHLWKKKKKKSFPPANLCLCKGGQEGVRGKTCYHCSPKRGEFLLLFSSLIPFAGWRRKERGNTQYLPASREARVEFTSCTFHSHWREGKRGKKKKRKAFLFSSSTSRLSVCQALG